MVENNPEIDAHRTTYDTKKAAADTERPKTPPGQPTHANKSAEDTTKSVGGTSRSATHQNSVGATSTSLH